MAWIPKKLTQEQTAERQAEEKTQVKIARDLGVSEAAVSVLHKALKKTIFLADKRTINCFITLLRTYNLGIMAPNRVEQ